MNLKIQTNCENINWDEVRNIIKTVGMTYVDTEIHRKSFENSEIVIFIFDNDKLIGFGRAISDGIRQASIYDVAVLPEYQGKSIGKLILENIVNKLPSCNFILYASPGKEGFYESLGFGKLSTGMGLFGDMERMKNRGFIK
ncbi:MAG: GNAT family N-acetyltransferase [Clostridium sp.]|uniref:GNAT family N-acetyltransferase n=1 Tax=Clostridium sp. TaxID=1506 RepID=UPI0029099958|nr:GNAT family N-acetyltransferase [Clostridium sp.]MDU5110773.1 GNAT family N-acetyltransferase [Clostridium sp.]